MTDEPIKRLDLLRSLRVVVIGSYNTDLVVWCEAIPTRGEVLMGGEFDMFCGGRGANCAVAAARAGCKVKFVGAHGPDLFGKMAVEQLERPYRSELSMDWPVQTRTAPDRANRHWKNKYGGMEVQEARRLRVRGHSLIRAIVYAKEPDLWNEGCQVKIIDTGFRRCLLSWRGSGTNPLFGLTPWSGFFYSQYAGHGRDQSTEALTSL
jgi:hypothetical protein